MDWSVAINMESPAEGKDAVSVQNVEFTRDSNNMYRCKICSFAVPSVLTRAHASRHLQRQSLKPQQRRSVQVAKSATVCVRSGV